MATPVGMCPICRLIHEHPGRSAEHCFKPLMQEVAKQTGLADHHRNVAMIRGQQLALERGFDKQRQASLRLLTAALRDMRGHAQAINDRVDRAATDLAVVDQAALARKRGL